MHLSTNALVKHGTTFWFNPDCLHAFRPDAALLTTSYVDYAQKPREQPQNLQAWAEARKKVREVARQAILAEDGAVMAEDGLELQIELQCGPLPMAGLLQERCLTHMRVQKADLRQPVVAAKKPPPKTLE